MIEKQYKELCEVCDQLLLAKDSKIERVAISWLHVIREHPIFLSKYEALFDEKYSISPGKAYTKTHGLLYFLRSIAGGSTPWFTSHELPADIDFLFLSHILSAEQAGKTDDFYFGNLPEKLLEQKKKVVIVLMNHTGIRAEKLIAKWSNCKLPRVLLTGNIGIADGNTLYKSMVQESKKLKHESLQSNNIFQQRVLLRASSEAISGSTFANLRLNRQIEALVEQLLPANIISTHEGHAFERVAFAGARKAKSGIRCIGYQHSALFRLQHAIRHKLEPEYNPSHIMTSGKMAKMQLEKEPGLNGINISVLGSNRNYEDLEPKVNVYKNDCCLVLPEGIMDECVILFKFSLQCANEMPEMQFIWRLHPSITFKALQKTDAIFRYLPNNVILSVDSLDNDIAQSQWVLYRGSTAVTKAVGAGNRPVYLSVPGEMTIDPLYEINEGKIIITHKDEFLQAFKNKDQNTNKKNTNRDKIKEYCRKYFAPFDPGVLTALDFLSN